MSLNHPLAAILTEARRMNAQTAISIHDAVRLVHGGSGLAQTSGGASSTGHGLTADRCGSRHRHRRWALRPRPGPGDRFGYGSARPNPGARAGILLLLTLGLAFMESLSLFTLVIVFVRFTTDSGSMLGNPDFL